MRNEVNVSQRTTTYNYVCFNDYLQCIFRCFILLNYISVTACHSFYYKKWAY